MSDIRRGSVFHMVRRGAGRRRAAPVVVALAVTAALGLSACSPAKVGAAAIIGDQRITTTQVNNASAGILKGNPQLANGGNGLDRTVVLYLVFAPWVLPAAAANGQGVSDQEAAKLLPKTPDPDPGSVLVLRTFLALQKMQQAGLSQPLAQVQKDITAANPKVSPRYGTFDAKTMSIVDAPPNWMVPKSEPTQTAGAQP